MTTVQIDYSQIRKIDMKNLCMTILDATKRFYDDPKNCKEFEAWQAARAVEENQNI